MRSLNNHFQKIKTNNRFDLYILGLIWLFHVITNSIWLLLDKYPPTWDSAHHLTMTLSWLDLFKTPSLPGLQAVLAASSYPPFSYFIISPFYLIFGKSADVAVLASGSLWLGLLLLATYGIGREVYNRKSGLLAACFFCGWAFRTALSFAETAGNAVEFALEASPCPGFTTALTLCFFFLFDVFFFCIRPMLHLKPVSYPAPLS